MRIAKPADKANLTAQYLLFGAVFLYSHEDVNPKMRLKDESTERVRFIDLRTSHESSVSKDHVVLLCRNAYLADWMPK